MYKTIWWVTELETHTTKKITYYHFGKEPKFPTSYMKEGIAYDIEMCFNFTLVNTPKIFFKCLFKKVVDK
jgi:hypothetical protein